MSSVRLSTESLNKFKAVLSVYRNSTSKNKWSSGETGTKRLDAVENKLLGYESEGSINRDAFLKEMAAFAYTAYKASWTKSSDSLSAQILTFVANELKMKKTEHQKIHTVPYAQPISVRDVESDKDFFKRVNETVNPTPPAVKKFLAGTEHSGFVRCYAGIPVTDAQRVSKTNTRNPVSSFTFRASAF